MHLFHYYNLAATFDTGVCMETIETARQRQIKTRENRLLTFLDAKPVGLPLPLVDTPVLPRALSDPVVPSLGPLPRVLRTIGKGIGTLLPYP